MAVFSSSVPGIVCAVGFYLSLAVSCDRYRRKVVRTNLKNSFPEKSAAELKAIERKFFHYLCDYMLEDVKMLRMSEKELCKRMTYENKETYLRMIDERGGIVLLIPHYANFEWITGMGNDYAGRCARAGIQALERCLSG